MFGLSINFHKSELFLFGEATERKDDFQRIFTCLIGELPMKYLGLPVDKTRIRNRHWRPVENKIEHRCACWQGKLLNTAGKVALL